MGPIDVFLLLGVGLLGRIIYRLYFHPLSGFPGPKLAAISHLYEFYNDVIKNGTYIWEIERMHQKYGPGYHSYPGDHVIASNILKDQLCESTLENSILRIHLIMKRSTQGAPRSATRIRNSLLSLQHHCLWFQRLATSITVFAVDFLAITSPNVP